MESLSVVIPIYNEAESIKKLIPHLNEELQNSDHEIILIDGGSTDKSLVVASEFNNVRIIKNSFANRAIQMNLGAHVALKDALFFLHADCFPPKNFFSLIQNKINASNLGCFYAQYKSDKFIFKLNSYFTKLPFEFCRGGDQGIFLLKKTFEQLKGFDENYAIMEEYDFFRRSKKANFNFCIINKPMEVSLRKYENRTWFKVNKANLIAMLMFRRNVDSHKIKERCKY